MSRSSSFHRPSCHGLGQLPLAAVAATLLLGAAACQAAPAGGQARGGAPAGLSAATLSAAGRSRTGPSGAGRSSVGGLLSTTSGQRGAAAGRHGSPGPRGTGGPGGSWSPGTVRGVHGGGGYVRGAKVPAAMMRQGRKIQATAHGGSASAHLTSASRARGGTRATLLASSSTTGTIDPGGDERLSTAKTGWATYAGVTATQLNSDLTASKARPTEIRVINPATPTFSVTMVADSGGYATSNWWWYYGLTASQVIPLANSLGARPISLQRYQSGGQTLFAVVLIPDTGSAAQTWYWYYGDTSYLSQQATANKARITRLHQYQVDSSGDHYFDALMTPDSGRTGTTWWGWWYGVSPAYVSQYLSAYHARLLDIEGNSDGTFNIVLTASAGAWVGWWYGPDVSAMVTMAARDDLRVLADDEYTTSSGSTSYVILTTENNPDQAAMRTGVLTQSLDAYQSQDGAANGLLQFSDSTYGTTNLTFGSVRYNAKTRVGSISKTFVATAILLLEAEGRLSISDSVGKWLPGVVPNGANITLEELLNHTAGINNYTDELAFTPGTMSQPFTPAQLVQIAVANPPYFAPGAGYHYSNTDYVLLAMVIEKITGAYYGDFITSHIIGPLGLTGTAVPEDTTIASPAMPGRWNDGSAVVTTTSQNASRWYGPGAVVSTVADVNTFYQALLSGKLLPAAQLSEMENDTVADGVPGQVYGLGLIKTTLGCGVTIAWHNGYVMGYETFSAHSLTGGRNITWTYNAPGGTDGGLDYDLAEAAFCRF